MTSTTTFMTEEMKRHYANINATYGIQAKEGLTEEEKNMVWDVIKALKAKPCEDCVSREFMYKLGAKCIAARDKDGELIAITSIESLPSVTPKQGWIPLTWDELKCESSYPDDMDGCWAIFTDGKNMSIERAKKDAIDHFYPSGRWFEMSDAIAWMPLPEPYKEGESE